jgi:hypothetical protein
MNKADVILTDMYGNVRVTLNTQLAIDSALEEPEIANYLTRKDGLVYLDIKKTYNNKKNMVMFCRRKKLTIIKE